MDKKMTRWIQEEMDREADLIMEEVNSDPSMKDVVAPEVIRERLFEQIRDYEARKQQNNLTEEEKELIRLGKKYRKNRHKGKYIILIAAVVSALGIGVTTMGGPKRVYKEVRWMFAGKEQTNIDTDSERIEKQESVSEAEVYEQIEQEYGFVPVSLDYLPDGVEFVEVNNYVELKAVQLVYKGTKSERITYKIFPNYRTTSVGTTLDDEVIDEFEKELQGNVITVRKLLVKESKEFKWQVFFDYKEVRYVLLLSGMDEEEIEQIIDNFYFS